MMTMSVRSSSLFLLFIMALPLIMIRRVDGFTATVFQPPRNLLVRMTLEVGDASAEEQETPKPTVKCPDCDLCDGSGRIPGGLGAVFPWIPIKAYRPCPNFLARGGRYQKTGQGLDEIAFGRDSSFKKRD